MSREFIPFNRPSITDLEREALLGALNSLWLTTGPQTKKFEESFKELTGAESALALNSCTAGLHLGLKALGVGPGDEVLTTPLTFCATANVIEHLGGRTVLADIDPETWLIDPQDIKKKITPKTKVILPVHLYGQVSDMVQINAIANEYGVKVLEDCAHCLPNFYQDGSFVGSQGNLCAFSFYATKNITTGEGGMLVGPTDLIDKCRPLSLHGMDKDAWKRFAKGGSWQYDVQEPGFKYNMTDLQASLGLVQLARMDELFKKRKKIALRYYEAFSGHSVIRMPRLDEASSFHLVPIAVDEEKTGIGRQDFIDEMTKANIGTSVHYKPIHFFSYYTEKYGWDKSDFPNASRIGSRCVTLPLFPDLKEEDHEYIIATVLDIIKRLSR